MGKYDRQLKEAGIRIVKERHPHRATVTYLEYNGKRIKKSWGSKLPEAVKYYFGIELPKIDQAKKKPVNRRKATGEAALFEAIWNSRPRISYISGTPLPYPDARCFFHVLGKGAYPKFRLYDKNIILTTAQEHEDWHTKTKAELLAKDPRWEKVFKLKEELIKQYKQNQVLIR